MDESEGTSTSRGLSSTPSSSKEDVDQKMESKDEGSSSIEHNLLARYKKKQSSCLILNEKTSKQTIMDWRRGAENNERIPIGFRRTSQNIGSEWAMAAEIGINKSPDSPKSQTNKRKDILQSIKNQVKTMGQEAKDRVREYAKGPQDPDHLKMIKRIFDEKKEQFDRYVETEGLQRWSKVFDKESPSKAVMIAPLQFDVEESETAQFIEYSEEEPGTIILSSPIIHLESCAVQPIQNYFLSINSNIKTRDTNTLSHIPYVSDKDHDEDAFTRDLVRLYHEGVHGTRRSYRKGINDRILFEMLARIGWMSRGEPILRDRYFAALHHLFPDKCSIRGIHKKVISLRKRFEEVRRLPYPAPSSNYYGDSWVQIREMEESDSCEDTDNNMCYVCGDYGCLRHDKIDPSIIMRYHNPRAPPREFLIEPSPCSFLCHFLFEERMLHQEKNIREKRWKFGEWRPFWYKIIVKRRKHSKRSKMSESEGGERMRGSDEDDDGCFISDLDEDESDFNDEDMSDMSENEDEDESENDELMRLASTSPHSSRISRSTNSEGELRNGGAIGSEVETNNREASEVDKEGSSSLSEEKVEDVRGNNSDGENSYCDRRNGVELVEEMEKIEHEEGPSITASKSEKGSEKVDTNEEEKQFEEKDGMDVDQEVRNEDEESIEEHEMKPESVEEGEEEESQSSISHTDKLEEYEDVHEKEERESITNEKLDNDDDEEEDSITVQSNCGSNEEMEKVGSCEDERIDVEDHENESEEDSEISGTSCEGSRSENGMEVNDEDEEEEESEGKNNDVESIRSTNELSLHENDVEKADEEEEIESNSEEEGSSEDESEPEDQITNRLIRVDSNGEIVEDNEESNEESSEEDEEEGVKEGDNGEMNEEDESQKISSDDNEEYEQEENGENSIIYGELAFMNRPGPSRIRERSESSREEDEEEWSDSSEWNDEIIDEDEDFKFVKTRRSYNISKRDVPPRKWRNWKKPNKIPIPFWTEKEEMKVKKALEAGKTVCDIMKELQSIWRSTGEMNRYRECYQVNAYLESRGLVTIKPEYQKEPKLSMYERMYLQRSWRTYNSTTVMQNDHSLRPCFHDGKCDEATPPCRCLLLDVACTKYCCCDMRCPIKFPGCTCAPGKCRSRQCSCYFASWECDPETCLTCGCDGKTAKKQCQNRSITLGKKKIIIAARSEVAGYGGFIGEDCKKGEMVDEYVGEIISVEESERRGHMYDKLRLSYTFSLNDDQVVDATRAGNVARFINHSQFPNCVARVFIVQGDHRIGIFARRDLVLGEELFFNYGYRKEHVEAFTNKERDGCDSLLFDDRGITHREEGLDLKLVKERIEEIPNEDDDEPSKFEKKIDLNKGIFKMLSPKKSEESL